MSYTPEYGAPQRQEITTEEVLAALLPDSPAAAVPQPSTPAPEARPSVPTVEELLAAAQRQGALLPAPPAPAPVPSGPVVPRWAVGTAVASVGVGVGSVLVAAALDMLSAAAAALAAGLAGLAGPLLVGAVVLLAVGASRRSSRGSVHVVQTVTQTVTQSVRVGR
ncbi:hypothetical protein [Streptomyces pini]|uniref:Uncharacterized protein n=1 Tax=Streptomyces pini TaxID=1520580 RepID=A0A1I4MED1_9ACTN|nr:hypothetical protein [Streptomyces pini]SFM01772.1 hypothetical protein SAMN05192584_14014 [Streptomyces pini]